MSIFSSVTTPMKKLILISSICLFMLTLVGCGDFFAEKPTELQAKQIISEVSKLNEDPCVSNPVPLVYSEKPKVLKTDKGIKLFYFTKHHSPAELAKLLTGQMGNKVTTIQATNQMIIACGSDKEVEQVLAFLEKVDVLPIQVKIDCVILEHYADVTMDWETKIQIDNLLGESITLGGKKDDNGNLLPAFPGASLREPKRGEFGLDIGYDNLGAEGHVIKAAIDVLVSRGYLKILMNPTVETVNGKSAKITSRDQVPLTKIVSGKDVDNPYQITEYVWVQDTLEVTPYVYSDGSIGLVTKAQIGSKSTPEGVVQLPIITERSIDVKENRLKPGHSLIIGGFRKTEKRSVVRGVPFLKDIPFFGILFSSKDFEDRAKEVIFILTPSISSNGMDYGEMIEMVREKQKDPDYCEGLEKVISDPFGTNDYTKQVERQAAEEEIKRIKAEIEAAETERDVQKARAKLKVYEDHMKLETRKAVEANEEIDKLKGQLKEVNKSKTELQKKSQEDANKAKAQTDAAIQQALEEKKKAQEARKEIEKLKAESAKRSQESEQLKKQIENANKQAQEAQSKAKQASDEVGKLKQLAEKLQEEMHQTDKAPQEKVAPEAQPSESKAEPEK